MTTIPDLRLKSRLYYYAGHVTSVYDGDTFTADVDLGLGLWRRDQIIRLWKVNAPEVRGASRVEGLRVRDFVRGLILDRDKGLAKLHGLVQSGLRSPEGPDEMGVLRRKAAQFLAAKEVKVCLHPSRHMAIAGNEVRKDDVVPVIFNV